MPNWSPTCRHRTCSWLADMVQLEQVLVNLVGNACDVLVNQPNRRIEVSARACGRTVVVLEVHDSGLAFPQQNLKRCSIRSYHHGERPGAPVCRSRIRSRSGWVGR